MNYVDWIWVFILVGMYVWLELLQMFYIDGLCGVLGDGVLLQFWYIQVFLVRIMIGYVQVVLQVQVEGKVLLFVVFNVDDEIVGIICYYGLEEEVLCFSIGYIWYGQVVQCIGVNIEVKLMLFIYVFECLQCLSVVFEISWFNFVLCIVIVCLGVKQDGVLCNYKCYVDGMLCDIVIFFIIDVEWQGVKCYLQYCLDVYV